MNTFPAGQSIPLTQLRTAAVKRRPPPNTVGGPSHSSTQPTLGADSTAAHSDSARATTLLGTSGTSFGPTPLGAPVQPATTGPSPLQPAQPLNPPVLSADDFSDIESLREPTSPVQPAGDLPNGGYGLSSLVVGPDAPSPPQRPWYRKKRFVLPIGATVIAGVVAGAVIGTRGASPVPVNLHTSTTSVGPTIQPSTTTTTRQTQTPTLTPTTFSSIVRSTTPGTPTPTSTVDTLLAGNYVLGGSLISDPCYDGASGTGFTCNSGYQGTWAFAPVGKSLSATPPNGLPAVFVTPDSNGQMSFTFHTSTSTEDGCTGAYVDSAVLQLDGDSVSVTGTITEKATFVNECDGNPAGSYCLCVFDISSSN